MMQPSIKPPLVIFVIKLCDERTLTQLNQPGQDKDTNDDTSENLETFLAGFFLERVGGSIDA